MFVTLTLIVCHDGWQPSQLDHSTQGINDPQHVFQSHGWLASLEVNNEAHPYPRYQRQLRLSQSDLLSRGPKRRTELLRGLNGCHGLINFPFGKLSHTTDLKASNIYRSGIYTLMQA
jgi:hypothetical protein